MKNDVLILGGTSFLGSHILIELNSRGREAKASTTLDSVDIDLDNTSWYKADILQVGMIDALIAQTSPDIVVNCIAVSDEASARKNPQLAYAVNGAFPGKLAGLCDTYGIELYHLSTSYVFDQYDNPQDEDSIPKSTTDLGITKLEGELGVAEYRGGHVLRVSEVWGDKLLPSQRGTVYNDIVAVIGSGETIDIPDNVFITPVSATDFRRVFVDLLEKSSIPNIVHITEENNHSVYDHAMYLPQVNMAKNIIAVTTEQTEPHSLGLNTKYKDLMKSLSFRNSWFKE